MKIRMLSLSAGIVEVMTLTEIYDRIEDLIAEIRKNPEDQDRLFKCESEIAALEQLREDIEENC